MPKYQNHTQKPKTTLPNPKPQQDKGTICAPWKPSLALNCRAPPWATETPNACAQLCCPEGLQACLVSLGELNSFSNTGPRLAALTDFPSLFSGSSAVLVGSLLPEKPQHAAALQLHLACCWLQDQRWQEWKKWSKLWGCLILICMLSIAYFIPSALFIYKYIFRYSPLML